MKLGELEKRVMEYVWDTCETCDFCVRDIMEGVNKRTSNEYAYNTILTVITHLFEKGLLERKKVGKSFQYRIAVSKESFVAQVSKNVFNQMKKDYGTLAIAHFAKLVDDVDPGLLKEAKKELE